MNLSEKARVISQNIGRAIIGKADKIDLVLTALLAGGHILLEDVPGTGKTQLAKVLAKSIGCGFNRVQFTPDLLPSDLTGINFYNPSSGAFTFRKGSLFTNILLGDEINRATPRTQSGLLESMEERQITVDGVTYPLEPPYFVIATQNPVETQGTFPLPEAQLDRFLIQTDLGYPQTDEAVDIVARYLSGDLLGASPSDARLLGTRPSGETEAVCTREELLAMQREARSVFVHPEVIRYIVALAEFTRGHENAALGVSTRGCLAMARAAQAYAAIKGQGFVTPDDVKYLVPYVFAHRIIPRGAAGGRGTRVARLLEDALGTVPVPTENFPPNTRKEA